MDKPQFPLMAFVVIGGVVLGFSIFGPFFGVIVCIAMVILSRAQQKLTKALKDLDNDDISQNDFLSDVSRGVRQQYQETVFHVDTDTKHRSMGRGTDKQR